MRVPELHLTRDDLLMAVLFIGSWGLLIVLWLLAVTA